MNAKTATAPQAREPAGTIIVIGGGSVGTSFLRQLSDEIAGRSQSSNVRRVILLEPKANPGAGDAYQQDTSSNLLNTRVGSMSAIAADPQHFLRWLHENPALWRERFPGSEPTADSFVPRALFGLYLSDVYDDAMRRLRERQVAVDHMRARATAVQCSGLGYVVHTEQGLHLQAASVVLAIGNLETHQWDHLRAYPGYFNTPYPCTRLIEHIEHQQSVCILGSGLSAIDAAVSLADAGHTGKIVMVSRNGRLPSVRGEQNLNRKLRILTRQRVQAFAAHRGAGWLSLREIAQMLFQELELCEGKMPDLEAIMRTGEGPHSYLDSEINDALAHDRAWQAIVYALNDSIDLIWHMLSDKERRVFQTRFKSLWHSYRVSFPIQNACKLQRLLHSDQLVVYSGYRDASFDDANGRFAVHVADSRKGFEAMLLADNLVNATGYTTEVSTCRSPLLRGMLVSGLARAHEFGGIDIDFDSGRVLSRGGAQLHGLFALGSIASGTYFWTNAMSVNTRLAAGVARRAVLDVEASQQAADHQDVSRLKLAA